MSAEWKQFEEAVAAFLQALDPSARVSHDQQLPDAHTGLARQRDVWIEASFGGHLAIKILVSCKRKKSKISQQDMDAFIGELASSGAHKGVLYSYGGFTKPALAKAAKLGISCCVLYKDAAPQLPEVLAFTAYHLFEHARIIVDPAPQPPGLTWSELLELPTNGEDGDGRPAIEVLAQRFHADDAAMNARLAELPPPQRMVEVGVVYDDDELPARMILQSQWIAHRAKLESWLVNGSYSLTDKDFKGSASTPSVDMWSSHPGPGWELIELDQIDSTKNLATFVRRSNNVAATMRASVRGNKEPVVRPNRETQA